VALLAECEVGLGVAGDRNWLGLVLNSLMPADDVVLTVGNVFDLVVPTLVGNGVVRCRHHNDVAGHLSMYVAQQGRDARLIESCPEKWCAATVPSAPACLASPAEP
jgi:hypothetical protein